MSARLWIVALLVVAAGCSKDERAANGSCAATLVWRDVTYVGSGTRVDYAPEAIRAEALKTGQSLGKAEEPRCGDVPRRSVRVAALAGVSPRLVIVAPSREGIYLAPGALSARVTDQPPRLRVLTAGKPCRGGPSRVSGRWIGEADPRAGFSWVQIIADEARGAARRYAGFIMDFKVDERTSGLNSRREWRRLHFYDDRVRIVATCVRGSAPNETFLAGWIRSATA